MYDDFGYQLDENGKLIQPVPSLTTVVALITIVATAWVVPFMVPWFR